MQYLITATEVLRFHLVAVADAWNPFNYDGTPGEFFLRRPSRIIRTVLRGLSAMAGRELAGERLAAALRSKSQEDEHSCFSDTTHNDLVANMEGIESILFGTFTNESGKVSIDEAGFLDLIASADSKMAAQVKEAFLTAQGRVKAIPAPFDQTIIAPEGSPEHKAAQDAVAALWEFVYTLSDAEEIMQLGVRAR